MRSESETAKAEAGFTLIEVMVAMVVLAFGLLAVEALGINAARAVTVAQRQSVHATLASDSLESALHRLRSGALPTSFCETGLPRGDRLSREVTITGNLARVVVRVTPDAAQPTSPRNAFQIETSLFLPLVPTGAISGTPCP